MLRHVGHEGRREPMREPREAGRRRVARVLVGYNASRHAATCRAAVRRAVLCRSAKETRAASWARLFEQFRNEAARAPMLDASTAAKAVEDSIRDHAAQQPHDACADDTTCDLIDFIFHCVGLPHVHVPVCAPARARMRFNWL